MRQSGAKCLVDAAKRPVRASQEGEGGTDGVAMGGCVYVARRGWEVE